MGTEDKDVSVIPVITNTVDDPNALSVTSVGPLPESVDPATKEAVKKEEESAPSKTEEEEEKEKPSEEGKEESSKETPPAEKPEPKPKDVVTPAVQRRIDEITKKFRTAEREREWERNKRLELEGQLAEAKKGIPQKDKPKLEDFESESDYLEALADWKVDQKFNAERGKTSEEQEKAAIREAYDQVEAKMERGREKHEDFDEVVLREDLAISEEIVAALVFSESAEEVLYYLGKHPEEAQDISELQGQQLAFELGKLHERLNAPPPPQPQKKTTRTPEPITPVKTTGLTARDPEKMTQKEYRAWREGNK